MPAKQLIPGVMMLVKWWEGPPVMVIVPNPPEPAIQIRTAKGSGVISACIPRGPIEARSLTNAEKRFLLNKGMNPSLFKSRRVFGVSGEAANRFDTSSKELLDLAGKCGLERDDVFRITEAKRKLAGFRPKTYNERSAARGLSELLSGNPVKKERGRPGKITAADRQQMRLEAAQLKQEGNTTDEIVRVLAQRYELRLSYTRRILEDASRTRLPCAKRSELVGSKSSLKSQEKKSKRPND